jgi:hypothetical protein
MTVLLSTELTIGIPLSKMWRRIQALSMPYKCRNVEAEVILICKFQWNWRCNPNGFPGQSSINTFIINYLFCECLTVFIQFWYEFLIHFTSCLKMKSLLLLTQKMCHVIHEDTAPNCMCLQFFSRIDGCYWSDLSVGFFVGKKKKKRKEGEIFYLMY